MIRLILSDLRYALRGLRRTPTFTFVALGTLALCIGANSAMFSVVNGVLLRPLPFPDSDKIVRVWSGESLTARQIDGITRQAKTYDALAGASPTSLTLTGIGTPELVPATIVGAQHFSVFGVPPVAGRPFDEADSRSGAPPVAILSHRLWQRRFGGDPDIIGRTLPLGGVGRSARTIVGITPPDYRPFEWDSDVLVPIAIEPGSHEYTDMAQYLLVARLSAGRTIQAATSELQPILARLAASDEQGYIHPDEAESARVVGEHDWRVGGVDRALWLLLVAVLMVLVIGCVNIANLMLARLASRESELAIRRALGADRWRIIRLLVSESLLIGLGGGVLGATAAFLVIPVLLSILPASIVRTEAITLDGTVLGFTLLVSLAAVVLFGLLPTLRSGQATGREAREATRTTTGGQHRLQLNRILVGAEFALCLILVSSAGLFLKSLASLGRVDPGFDQHDLITLTVTPSPDRYPTEEDRRLLLTSVEASIASIAGVENVGAIQVRPMTPGNMGVGISPDGSPVPDDKRPLLVSYRIVTPDYFSTMRINLQAGRYLEETDRSDAAPVGLVNEAMAKAMWPGENAVGREVSWDDGSLWFTVVGVVADVHQNSLSRAPRVEAYVPFAQDTWPASMHVMVRTHGSVSLNTIRQSIWRAAPDLPVTSESTMEAVVERSLATPRFHSTLFGLFAVLALLLAAVGVYGVTSYLVGMRTREIGIRMAFGASRRDILEWLMRSGGGPVLLGIGMGLAGALLSTRLLRSMLFGVAPTDPAVLAAVAVLLCAVALLAMAVPARRATRVSPLQSLNEQ